MLKRFLQWVFAPYAPTRAEKAAILDRPTWFTTEDQGEDLLAGSRAGRLDAIKARVFKTTVADGRVYHTGAAKGMTGSEAFAMDASNAEDGLKEIYTLNESGVPDMALGWYASQGFIGFQVCAILAQQWLVKKACLIPARDAIRKGYEITVNDGEQVAPALLDKLRKSDIRWGIKRKAVEFVNMGRVFGIRIALFKVDSTDTSYYQKPFNPDGITPGSYKGVVQIDPYWCAPELTTAGASDPTAADFYEPTYWIINGTRYHRTHLVIMRGPEIADVFKPSYLYAGMSVPQQVYERVYAAERTANEAPALALSKRSTILYTDTAKALANEGNFVTKLLKWSQFRDNFGVKVVDKDGDKIEQQDTALGDLDAVIMSQYQLVAAAANIPVTKLLGTVPKGFNSTGEYEEASYHEELETIQTNDMAPFLNRHHICVIRSELTERGAKPFTVEVVFKPLDSLTEEEQATVNKTKADTDVVLITAGVILPEEARARVSKDAHSGHDGIPLLDDEDARDPLDGPTIAPVPPRIAQDGWVTLEPSGSHVLIGEGGKVEGGAGGKLDGKKLGGARSSPSPSPSPAPAASAPVPAAPKPAPAPPAAPVPAAPAKPAQGAEAHEAAKAELSAPEKAAMQNYTGSMYVDMNKRLRADKPVAKADQKDLAKMDDAFSRAATTKDMTVYRGVNGAAFESMKPGDSFHDKAFSSTSSSKGTADVFTGYGKGQAILQVSVPKGSKAVSADSFSKFGAAAAQKAGGKTEGEIILNRGGKYKVTKVEPAKGNNPRVIHVEYSE